MASKNYYAALGVNRNAPEKEIKSAFKRLALQYHPDKNPDNPRAEEKFNQICEAYQVLKDSQKRKKYDLYGANWQSKNGKSEPEPEEDIDHDSLFKEIFGDYFSSSKKRGGVKGADLKCQVNLSFEEAINGCEKEISLKAEIKCSQCGGSGARTKKSKNQCKTCGGSGQVQVQQGFFNVPRKCPDCQGQGTLIIDPCPKCQGKGKIPGARYITVKIPDGVKDAARLKINGEGGTGKKGGEAGDLFIDVTVQEHPFFTRKEKDIFCEVPISFASAALGNKIEVPTVDGKVKITVKPGIQSGTTLRLQGKGVGKGRGKQDKRGDQLVKVVIETPTNLNREQKRLLNKFEEISKPDAHPVRKSFLDKLKELTKIA